MPSQRFHDLLWRQRRHLFLQIGVPCRKLNELKRQMENLGAKDSLYASRYEGTWWLRPGTRHRTGRYMRRILFVDDQEEILNLHRESFKKYAEQVETLFALGGRA